VEQLKLFDTSYRVGTVRTPNTRHKGISIYDSFVAPRGIPTEDVALRTPYDTHLTSGKQGGYRSNCITINPQSYFAGVEAQFVNLHDSFNGEAYDIGSSGRSLQPQSELGSVLPHSVETLIHRETSSSLPETEDGFERISTYGGDNLTSQINETMLGTAEERVEELRRSYEQHGVQRPYKIRSMIVGEPRIDVRRGMNARSATVVAPFATLYGGSAE
jgi:hypothetical protein